ncbi:sensor histidine kinase [Agrilactobacillus yilanensis]|uniref:histidine kinase n=1 Tax=Agrilactobacillus yilanensis TaxID=2485997 RepID=A0ABW4J7U3_9LACO|nr:HAMP domain-containing sensor histidine kinase [Agrilactobacillus yilanensis]
MQAEKVYKKIVLTAKEKSELIVEGIITVGLLLVFELALILLVNQAFNTSFSGSLSLIRVIVTADTWRFHWGLWRLLFFVVLLLVNGLIVYWRLMRRYRQIQMRHVISELHYIADSHFDHRIEFKVGSDLQKVIDSINALVESTSRSINEERRIERSKDELITNVSHDIRTPLTSVIGYLGLIEDGQYKNEAELVKYTRTAYVKSKQMKVLVDDLFEFTKIQQTATSMSYASINMTNMLAQLAAGYELEAQKSNIHIITTTRPDPLMMDADPEKLSRVFNNLIINAFKYGEGATELLIEARQSNSEVIIQISNDGKMIPKADLAHLFDRFYRVESSRSHETGGSGLGLAIAQSIVALHGGYIYAVSRNERTRFIMHLPLKHGARLIKPENVAARDAKFLNHV